MRFLRPDFTTWWEILPVLVACWVLRVAYVRSVRRGQRPPPRLARLSRRTTWAREAGVLGLSIVAAGALVFALLRPQVLLAQRTPEIERQDLIVMLDRSASMRAHDIQPSRFSRATLEIQNFLRNKPEAIDRVGLVGFADASLILSYLTKDVDNISFYLDWIDRDPQTLLGTDIGAALKSALEVAKKDDRQTRKIFLLVSDGEDYGDELSRQVAAYRSLGYHINCIGIGSDQEVPVPVLDPTGRETPLRDERGRIVKTKFEESTLRQIAAATGGRYVRSTTGSELTRAIADIVQGERRVLGWRTSTEYRDLYPAGLAVAAAAGAVVWLLL
ncbi:MAG: vWA domain-containing protein [Betaproteobacteria bacterium]